MSEKKAIARVGNFIVTKESGNGMEWVSVKASSGFWTMRFREDNQMYHTILMLCENENLYSYLEGWINSVYVLSNTTPDSEFFEAFYNAYDAMNKRKQAEPLSDKEDVGILEDVKAMEEMKEQAKKEIDNENKNAE